MSVESWNKSADFFIKVAMMVVTFGALLFFSAYIIATLYLLAIIIKGITDFLIARKKE